MRKFWAKAPVNPEEKPPMTRTCALRVNRQRRAPVRALASDPLGTVSGGSVARSNEVKCVQLRAADVAGEDQVTDGLDHISAPSRLPFPPARIHSRRSA